MEVVNVATIKENRIFIWKLRIFGNVGVEGGNVGKELTNFGIGVVGIKEVGQLKDVNIWLNNNFRIYHSAGLQVFLEVI